jgi:hypothetical protein
MPVKVGDDVNICSVKWICAKPCTLIGYTLEDGLPVIAGPTGAVMSDHHFILASYFKTKPKPGQSYLEIMALRRYEKIGPEELEGKSIKSCCSRWSEVIIICDDNSYCKLVAEREQYDGGLMLSENDLTFDDLRGIGAISDEDFTAYEEEKKANREEVKAAEAIRRFRAAAEQIGLGIEKVEELLNATN